MKTKKRKGIKNNKMQVKTSEKEQCTNEARETLEGNGVDYEEKLKKSKKLQMKSRKDNEMVRIEHDKLNRKVRMLKCVIES